MKYKQDPPPQLTDKQKEEVKKFMKKNSRGDWNGWTADDLYNYGWYSIPESERKNANLNSILNIGLKKYDLYSDIPEMKTYTNDPNSSYGKKPAIDHAAMMNIWKGIQMHPNGTIVGYENTPSGAFKLKLLKDNRPDVYNEERDKIFDQIATELNSYLTKGKMHPYLIRRDGYDIHRDYNPIIMNHPDYGTLYFSTKDGRFIPDNRAPKGYTAQNYDDFGEPVEVDGSTLNRPYIEADKLQQYENQQELNKWKELDRYNDKKNRTNALGGRTSRLYANGGEMGQIPLGEQEDYNMVGAGGSHEMNPQGGVPYGVNQDGTQNMVEEGEVSVGDKVFSDRTQLTPELCQQLGLPEGTSPAQAMQQIEALYEQGQIGDEEFQEIQNIIFQDQESQKQGEMQQEMPPNEGISPDMIQGANMPQGGGMPPEMMQQQGAPMTPQNEGIQPEMVQGYAYGGRMW